MEIFAGGIGPRSPRNSPGGDIHTDPISEDERPRIKSGAGCSLLRGARAGEGGRGFGAVDAEAAEPELDGRGRMV